MEKEIFSEKTVELENGESVVLHYFITKSDIKYKNMKSPVYGIEISKYCGNVFVEKEGDYGVTEKREDILKLADMISKYNVMPSSLLNIIDDFVS